MTVTTTPTVSANSEQLQQKSGGGSGVSGGVVAAIVIAVFVALAAIIAALVFMLYRRRRANRQLMLENESLGGPQRMNSQMSKNGLLSSPAPALIFGAGTQSSAPDSAGSNGLSRRDSRPLYYDQRLNPNAIMIQENPSRNSINTLDDHRDYGRRLNVSDA